MMKRFSSNSVAPSRLLSDALIATNATMTTPPVRIVARQPHRRAEEKRANTKYVKKGLDGPTVKYWKRADTAMSAMSVARGNRPALERGHMIAATATA